MILVVMDHLSKYAYFVGLKHPFLAKIIVEASTKEVVHLHGILLSIVFDRAKSSCAPFGGSSICSKGPNSPTTQQIIPKSIANLRW